MIVGVGTDIIEVARLLPKVDGGKGFREMVFSADEIAYCETTTNRAEHYAARFAAKEAFLKAAGFGLTMSYELNRVEIIHDATGKPVLNLKGEFLEIAIERQWKRLHVSMSHVNSFATAIVLIEK